jgi:hypothetical protein
VLTQRKIDMSEPLYVHTDGMRSIAQIHDEVVAGISQVMGAAAPEAVGVQTSHGVIASAVSTALSNVLSARQGTLQTTAKSGSTISELLAKAAQMYDQGDREGAAKLRAAAEVLDGKPDGQAATAGAAARSASTPAGAGAGSGAEGMGQIFGQIGQQAAQMAQAAVQPLGAIAQGLGQIPQQIMQGVQQASQAAQSAAKTGNADGKTPERDRRDERSKDPSSETRDEREEARRKPADRAAAGDSARTGPAPETPRAPRAERPQTRPAD